MWLPHTVGMCQMEPCSSAVFEKRSGNERTTVEARPFLFLLQTRVTWLSLRAAVKSLDSHKHLQAGITPVNTQNKQQASPRCISLPFIRLKRKKHNYHICIIPLQNESLSSFKDIASSPSHFLQGYYCHLENLSPPDNKFSG